MDGSIGSMMDGVNNVVGMLAKADPLNDLIDVGASLLGLPPELKDGIKIAAGVALCDPNLVVTGGVGLATDLVHDLEGATPTEYHHPCGSRPEADPCSGYAPHQAHSSGQRPPPSGAPSGTSGAPAPGGPRGTPPPGHSASPASPSALDPDTYRYRDALQVLQANFPTLDAGCRADGHISRQDLQAVAADPYASPKLKEAVNFLLQHREYENRLEHASRPHGVGGAPVTLGSVSAELGRVNQQIATYGASPAGSGSSCSPGSSAPGGGDYTPDFGDSTSPPPPASSSNSAGGSSLRQLLADPSMSIEDKIDALCSQMMAGIDSQIEDVMGQMADAQDKESATGKQMADAAGGDKKSAKSGAQAQVQHQEAQRSLEQLQMQMQKLMERRSQMFTLQTNMSEKFNEMAKQALQNLGRA